MLSIHACAIGVLRAQRASRRRARGLAAGLVWLALAAWPARAAVIGDMELLSRRGEPFAARIGVQTAPDEELATTCVAVTPPAIARDGVEPLKRGHVVVEVVGGQQWLSVRSAALATAPAVGFRVEIGCGSVQARDFVAVLVTPPVSRVAVYTAAAAPAPASVVTPPAPVVATSEERAAPRLPRARKPTVPESIAEPARAPAATRRPRAAPRLLPAEPRFVLRLDTAELDVSRSSGLTDAQREELRRTLNADDGTAALLAVQERVRVLESQLAAMHSAVKAASAPAPVAAQATAPAQPTTVPAEPATVPAKSTTVSAEPATAPAQPTTVAAEPATAIDTETVALAFALLSLLAVGGVLVARRRRSIPTLEDDVGEEELLPRRVAALRAVETLRMTSAAKPAPAPREHEESPPASPVVAADVPADSTPSAAEPASEAEPAALFDSIEFTLPEPYVPLESAPPATLKPPAADATRAAQEEYLAGRYGAVGCETIVIGDPGSAVDRARMHYLDDGDTLKAVDLLELTVALHPDAFEPWLALFAIYRREALLRQYENLAQRFQARFPAHAKWPTVQQLGREIDHGNPLYAAAGTSPAMDAGELRHDLTNDWLGVPLDFTETLLATELHDRLLNSVTAAPAPQARVAAR